MRGLVLIVIAPVFAQAPDPVLDKIIANARQATSVLPDFICQQNVERTQTPPDSKQARPLDTLELEVTLLKGRERHTRAGGAAFDDRELRDFTKRGMVSTGAFGDHARHIFKPGAADFKPAGEETVADRKMLRYTYEVPWDNSSYKVSVPPNESVVGFRGVVVVDAETHELRRLEIGSDEIPPELGLEQLRNVHHYAMKRIGEKEVLLAVESVTTVRTLDKWENTNRTKLGACRKFEAETSIRFDDAAPAPKPAAQAPAPAVAAKTPAKLPVDMELADDVELSAINLGDAVRAVLSKPLLHDEKVIAPAGAILHGRIVRLERRDKPLDLYEVGFEFHTLEAGSAKLDFDATLDETENASGLVRELKRMDPVFQKRRSTRFDILVRETPRGQGILHWSAKNPRIKKGFRMRWKTAGD